MKDKEKIENYYKCILRHIKEDLLNSHNKRGDWYFIKDDGYYDDIYIEYVVNKLRKKYPMMNIKIHYSGREDNEYCFLVTNGKE